jgi:fumarate reductase (CoM/CoB) subunit A
MDEIRTDVLVIGSGAAGLRAAISAAASGCRVLVISKGTPALGSATLLSDGFFASSGEDMTPDEHTAITLEVGYHMNKPEMVKALAEETPARLNELIRRGLALSASRGGMRAPKVRHGRSTIPDVLKAWASEAGVGFAGWTTAVELITEENRITGCAVLMKGKPATIRAKAIVLCTGGASALFLSHDNPGSNIGDGYALAARSGASLKDMEFSQFYPFVTSIPGKPRVLMTPPVSDIGRIINDLGEDMVDKYDLGAFKPLGMKARDRLSRALFQEYLAGHTTYLSLTHMTDDDWRLPNAGPELRTLFEKRYGSAFSPVPIMPAAHFTMGGIEIDEHCRTSVDGLFVAGEAACGLHGANRMGGNALSETLVFGARAGMAAAAWADSVSFGTAAACEHPIGSDPSGVSPGTVLGELKSILWKYCGLVRTVKGLTAGIEAVKGLDQKKIICRTSGQAATAISVKNALFTAHVMCEAALARHESLGAHYIED